MRDAVVIIHRNFLRFFFVTVLRKHALHNFYDTRISFENNVMVLNKENQGNNLIDAQLSA